MLIYVIDDDPIEGHFLEGLIEQHWPDKEYQFLSFLSLEDYERLGAGACPDLIFIDRNLPSVSSFSQTWEVIGKRLKGAVVVLLSAALNDYSPIALEGAELVFGPIEKIALTDDDIILEILAAVEAKRNSQ